MLKARDLRINNSIWLLTINDVFVWGVYFVFSVLAGIYLSQKLGVNVAEMIGIGSGIGYFTRALVQIPIGLISDRIRDEKDEVFFLMLGNILMGLPVVLTTQVTTASFYYFLQFLFGLGAALNLVDWRKLFAKNLDKGREGLNYAVYDTIMSFSIAIFSVLSGSVAIISQYHFGVVITLSGMLMISSNIWVLLMYVQQIRRKPKSVVDLPQQRVNGPF